MSDTPEVARDEGLVSVQREQASDIGGDAIRQCRPRCLLVLLTVAEHRAIRKLPAGQDFAQLLGPAGTGLEERGERLLGYLVNRGPGEGCKFAVQRRTGKQSGLAEIVSRHQSDDLDLSSIFLSRSNENAVTDDA